MLYLLKNAMTTLFVENSLTNIVGTCTSNDAQEKMEPSNIGVNGDDGSQHEKTNSLPTLRQKRKIIHPRRYIECGCIAYALTIVIEVESQ